MKLIEKITYPFIYILIIVGIIWSYQDLSSFEGFYVREDGPIEWLQFIGLVIAMMLCWYRASILRPFRSRIFYASLVLMGMVFLFGAGEEISWGQRIFNIKSGAFFQGHNSQMETNLHNLVLSGFKVNRYIFGTFLGIIIAFYFLIVPVLYRKFPKFSAFIDNMGLPIPKIFHLVNFLLIFLLVKLTPSGKKGELLEFGGIWVFLLMMFNPLNRKIFSRVSFDR